MYILENLEPKKVFAFFEELSRIPRGSGNEKAASDYIVSFAKERGLSVVQDKAWNVIIKKPASKGYENAPGVILQGHIDMVNEKNQDTVHDFEKDPIKLIIDGDFIKADGTTLGADNGVAIALMMGILDDNELSHPCIEALFTTDEEVGMGGANALDPSLLSARKLINLDVGPEGHFFAGCAGGLRQRIIVDAVYENVKPGFKAYTIKIRNLQGGHSGGLIHMELGNSNKLLGRALNCLDRQCDIQIAHVCGGSKENAIPREADANICINEKDAKKAESLIARLDEILKKEYRKSDPKVSLTIEPCEMPEKVFSKDTAYKVIKAYMLMPYGLIAKSLDIEGLTETSTNLGVVTTDDKEIVFSNATRSSVGSRKEYVKEQFIALAEVLGVRLEQGNSYPAWEFNPDSALRDKAVQTYEEMFKEKATITATHGGLECGVFTEKLQGVDIVALGPTAYGAHTPEEKLSISSMGRTWEYLKKLLENLND